jgi:hypothetical protein
MVVTIVDTKELGLPLKGDMFIVANTGASLYTNNNPAITLDSNTLVDSNEYVKKIHKDDWGSCKTYGHSASGVLTLPIWFIKKFKSVMEMMS